MERFAPAVSAVPDIEELLSRFLPRRDVSKKEIVRQLEHRHKKRLSAMKSHARMNE